MYIYINMYYIIYIIILLILLYIYHIYHIRIKKIFFNHIYIDNNNYTLKILKCIDDNDWSSTRAKYNNVHEHTKSITIIDQKQNILVDENKYYAVFDFLKNFINKYKGELYTVKIVLLPKNKEIKPHIDGIRNNKKYNNYYDNKDRYHLVLMGDYYLYCNNNVKYLKEGDIWWFNNKKIHSVKSISDRISLIFDIKH